MFENVGTFDDTGKSLGKRPTSLPNAPPHTFLWLGCLIRWRYSNKSPVSSSNTDPANSKKICNGYFLLAAFCESIWYEVRDIWQQDSMNSFMILKLVLWERVLRDGVSLLSLSSMVSVGTNSGRFYLWPPSEVDYPWAPSVSTLLSWWRVSLLSHCNPL